MEYKSRELGLAEGTNVCELCGQVKSRVELWSLFGFFDEEQRGNGSWRTNGQMGWIIGWSDSHGLRRSDDVHGCVDCSE